MATRTQHHGLDVHHVPGFYDVARSAEIIEHLKATEYNSDEDSQVQVYGKWYNIPRQQVAFGDPGTTYTFSKNTVPAKQWPLWIENIRTELAEWCYDNMPEIDWDGGNDSPPNGALPSFVLVNHYRSGSDKIGFHSDDEKDLAGVLNTETNKHETVVLSLSFGVTREFAFQNKTAKARKRSFMLRNGDLCVMRGDTQKTWKHAITEGLPEGKFADSASRWNLTFRWMVPKVVEKVIEKTLIEVGAHILSSSGTEFEVYEVTKAGTPKVRQISGSQEKTLHWSSKNHCWQLFGDPIKWTGK